MKKEVSKPNFQKVIDFINNPHYQKKFENQWVGITQDGSVCGYTDDLNKPTEVDLTGLILIKFGKFEGELEKDTSKVKNENRFVVAIHDKDGKYRRCVVDNLRTCQNCHYSMVFQDSTNLQCIHTFKDVLENQVRHAVTGSKLSIEKVLSDTILHYDYTCYSARKEEGSCGLIGKHWKPKEDKKCQE